MPKVSVVIPVYNVEKYLRQCLESVVNQTLQDIEIICVNDGSKDSSLQIMQEYQARDARIRIIDKENSGYGASMNQGFDAATGEYLGIVESDDYAEPEMFEMLYAVAKADDLDVVKSGFFFYYSQPEEKNIPSPVASSVMCKRVFCPVTDFKSPMEQAEFFNIKPTIWSAIYKTKFIRDNHIRFNETPGASYQDASFNFKVWTCAQRVRLVEDCFLHYRQDNENSSVNSPGKVYCVVDEYNEMERFLKEEKPELRGVMEGIRCRLKYDSYMWNFGRLNEELASEFLLYASKDFAKDMAGGLCEFKYYPYYKWKNLLEIIRTPKAFIKRQKAEKERAKKALEGMFRTGNYKAPLRSSEMPSKPLESTLHRYWRQGRECVRYYGWRFTLGKVVRKITRRFFK